MTEIDEEQFALRFEQFWAMRNGTHGKYGNLGNAESASCRFEIPLQSSNPTLTARKQRT
jgi:hypothetical protein